MKRMTSLILTALLLVLGGCAARPEEAKTTASVPAGENEGETDSDRLDVVVSFYALSELVSAVGGDRVSIHVVVPDGARAHGFEPKAGDLIQIGSTRLFFINGLNLEPWAERAVAAAGNPDLVLIDTSQNVDVLIHEEHEDEEHEDDEHEDGEHDHGPEDPHIWLGLSSAARQVENIVQALSEADPAHRSEYESRGRDFVAKLDALRVEYQQKFAALENRVFVTGHAAFGYLCRDFGLEQNSVQNLFAEGEPSARQLAELVEFSRQHGVTTIFAEKLASPEVASTLASEIDAKVEIIHTLEAREGDRDYLDLMQENLERIYAALQD